MQYMDAVPLARAKEIRDDDSIVEIVIRELPDERGKGDHRHIGNEEFDYVFTSVEQLLEDFRSDVERWE
jgi:hypothetical protein